MNIPCETNDDCSVDGIIRICFKNVEFMPDLKLRPLNENISHVFGSADEGYTFCDCSSAYGFVGPECETETKMTVYLKFAYYFSAIFATVLTIGMKIILFKFLYWNYGSIRRAKHKTALISGQPFCCLLHWWLNIPIVVFIM